METDIDQIKILLKANALTGYIWMVEDKIPTIYTNEKVNFKALNRTGSSFNKIQEANLRGLDFSIHIKNIDGKEQWYVHEDNILKTKAEDHLVTELVIGEDLVFPSSKNAIPMLKYRQIYQLTASEVSIGFETYQPVFKQFMGFKEN